MENLTVGLVLLNVIVLIISAGLNIISNIRLKKLEQKFTKDNEIFKYKFLKQRDIEEKLMKLVVSTQQIVIDFSITKVDDDAQLKKEFENVNQIVEKYRNFLNENDSYLDDDIKKYARDISTDFTKIYVGSFLLNGLKVDKSEIDAPTMHKLKDELSNAYQEINNSRVELSNAMKRKLEEGS